jgi:hypothetical protein
MRGTLRTVEEHSSIFRKLQVDAVPNILLTIYFCENLNDFPVGREAVVDKNSVPFVLANQYPKLSPTCETVILDYALISTVTCDEHYVVRTPSTINNTPLSKNRPVFHLAASPSTS